MLASHLALATDATWEYAVRVSATVETSPAKITLHWPQDTQTVPHNYIVYRKSQSAASWAGGTTLPGSATSYVDTAVTTDGAYEYQIVKHTPTYTGYGYIFAGINAPLIENRGKVILMVEKAYATELAAELAESQQAREGRVASSSREKP